MRTIVVGEGAAVRQFHLEDPDAPNEAEFEFAAAKALMAVYSSYRCVLFGGTFEWYGDRHRPDLALVAKDFSHWFVVEVELVSHSFEHHVLPQVRTFRWGEPLPDCVSSLAQKLAIDKTQAETLVHLVPRSVAVIANRHDPEWEKALSVVDVQMLVVSRFRAGTGETALEVQGTLSVLEENLGFGTYSAVDRSLRFPRTVRLPLGRVQFSDIDGALSWWIIAEHNDLRWITKEQGTPSFPNGALVQIIRAIDGKLSMRMTINGPSRQG